MMPHLVVVGQNWVVREFVSKGFNVHLNMQLHTSAQTFMCFVWRHAVLRNV